LTTEAFPGETAFKEKLLRRSGSERTWHQYRSSVLQFADYCSERYHKDLAKVLAEMKVNKRDLYQTLDQFAGALNTKGLMPATIKTSLKGVRKYLKFQGLKIDLEKYKDEVTQPLIDEIMDEPIEPSTIRKMLVSGMPEQLKLIIAVAKSSGMRIGELLQIQLEDIHFEDPCRISIRREYVKVTNKRRGRDVFIDPEAVELLKEWITRNNIKSGRIFTYDDRSLGHVYSRWLKRLGLDDKIPGHVFRKLHFHNYRKFFFSKAVGEMGETATHALMGHSTYLDTYFHKPLSERQNDYKKAVPAVVSVCSKARGDRPDSKCDNGSI
jgi:integrase